ncbi:MAG TPA: hypothetical protein VLA21_05685 [Candidatus Limnocylindria bacterium]|nr:hypothetical protein [Candidatus Limnocylindria bacterium]
MKRSARFFCILLAGILSVSWVAAAAPASGGGLMGFARGLAYLGDWEAAYIDAGDGVPRSEYFGMNPAEAMAFTLLAGGTMTIRIQGQEGPGAWEAVEGGVRTDVEGERNDLLMEGDYLTLRDGTMTIYFRRAGTNPPAPQGAAPQVTQAPATPAPDMAEGPAGGYAGVWTPLRYEMGGYTFDIRMLFVEGGDITLRPDGTGEAALAPGYSEPLSWSESGGALTLQGSMFLSGPAWDAQSQELTLDYTSPDIKVVYARKDAGEPAATAEPTRVPALEPPATPAPPTQAPDTPAPHLPVPSGAVVETDLFTATFPEGWAENEGWRSTFGGYASVTVDKPGAGGWADGSVTIQASTEGVGSYRDKVRELDGYAQKAGLEKAGETAIGGIPFVTAEYERWGTRAVGYAARVPESQVTLYVTADQADNIAADLPAILGSITFTLPALDPPGQDPPLPEDGRRLEPQGGTAALGDLELTARWLRSGEPIVVNDVFSAHAAVAGGTLYTLSGDALQAFEVNGDTLAPRDGGMRLPEEFDQLSAGKDGLLYVAQGFWNILAVRDGEVVADNAVGGFLAMHPDGEWGVGYWANADTKRVTAQGGSLTEEPWILTGLSDPAARQGRFSNLSCVYVARDRVYAAGNDALSGDAQRVAAYDLEGNELLTFGAADWMKDDALGSVTAMAETPAGILVLDGNYRALKLFSPEGEFLGQVEDLDELLGTDYPWPCAMGTLPDGGVFIAVAQARDDESADELLVFRVTGL